MLKIKDKLYKYSFMSGVMEYEVFEIRRQENNVIYAIRCLNCKDHENCELLVVNPKEKKQDYYEYVCMLNNNGENIRAEYYWHDTLDECFYWATKEIAIKKEYEKYIERCQEDISNLEADIKTKKEKIKETEILIENLINRKEEI